MIWRKLLYGVAGVAFLYSLVAFWAEEWAFGGVAFGVFAGLIWLLTDPNWPVSPPEGKA